LHAYELILIVHPDLEDSAFKELVEKIKAWITGAGGQVSKVDLWGKRQLAYPIRKQKEGQYVLVHSQLDPAFCSELERNLKIQESVLRFLLTVQDA
jgi:small subunit ribosomal protein S6